MNCGSGQLSVGNDTVQRLANSLAIAWDIARSGDSDCEAMYEQAVQAGEDESAVDQAWHRMKWAERQRELGDALTGNVEAQAIAAGVDVRDVIALAEAI
jgi:hypothetical protein